jgi:fucose 4-O-acetylase-like acetyltransferase
MDGAVNGWFIISAAERVFQHKPTAVYIYTLSKIHKAATHMFWRKKQLPWYLKALLILIILRIIYAFAKFFMKAADKHAGNTEVSGKNDK